MGKISHSSWFISEEDLFVFIYVQDFFISTCLKLEMLETHLRHGRVFSLDSHGSIMRVCDVQTALGTGSWSEYQRYSARWRCNVLKFVCSE